MTPVVEDHDRRVPGELGDVVGEVLFGPGEAMREHERGPGAGHLDLEPDAIVGGDPHEAPSAWAADAARLVIYEHGAPGTGRCAPASRLGPVGTAAAERSAARGA